MVEQELWHSIAAEGADSIAASGCSAALVLLLSDVVSAVEKQAWKAPDIPFWGAGEHFQKIKLRPWSSASQGDEDGDLPPW